MAKVRRVIKHVDVEFAKGRRGCKRDKNHSIPAGSPCLVIFDPGTPYKKCYCPECALAILKQCASDLRDIRDAMFGTEFVAKPAAAETAGEALVKANRKRAQEKQRNMFQVTGYANASEGLSEKEKHSFNVKNAALSG